jgi:hypothetical protein
MQQETEYQDSTEHAAEPEYWKGTERAIERNIKGEDQLAGVTSISAKGATTYQPRPKA